MKFKIDPKLLEDLEIKAKELATYRKNNAGRKNIETSNETNSFAGTEA